MLQSLLIFRWRDNDPERTPEVDLAALHVTRLSDGPLANKDHIVISRAPVAYHLPREVEITSASVQHLGKKGCQSKVSFWGGYSLQPSHDHRCLSVAELKADRDSRWQLQGWGQGLNRCGSKAGLAWLVTSAACAEVLRDAVVHVEEGVEDLATVARIQPVILAPRVPVVCVLVLAFADLMLQGGLLLLSNPTREWCHARKKHRLLLREKLGILGRELTLRIA